MRRYKGVDLLLDAAPEIVRRTQARIAIVGEVFPDARDLLRRAEASPVRDRIVWKDAYVPEEEMALWLAACDVVALPYRAISGSGIAARAFAAGRPVAASAVGGLVEAVEPGGTGELFPPGDSAALARAVETVLARGDDAYAPVSLARPSAPRGPSTSTRCRHSSFLCPLVAVRIVAARGVSHAGRRFSGEETEAISPLIFTVRAADR